MEACLHVWSLVCLFYLAGRAAYSIIQVHIILLLAGDGLCALCR